MGGFALIGFGFAIYWLLFREKIVPCEAPCVAGDESIMSPKEHGTSRTPVLANLRWSVDRDLADRICNFNRHGAEGKHYFERATDFLSEARALEEPESMDFFDSNTRNLLFAVPSDDGRSWGDFLDESIRHGWPSFRDEEVNWEYVRALPNGEIVSVNGTHLGHNLPDSEGNRYCINLVSVAG